MAKGLCPDCEKFHHADEPCQYTCERCDQIMESPDEAEGCRDYACPMQEWAAETAIDNWHVLESNRKYHRTTRPPTEELMTDIMKSGGPVYPVTMPGLSPDGKMPYDEHYSGMRVRQYYKAAALTGVLPLLMSQNAEPAITETDIAKLCSAFADAMIAEDEEHANGK